MKSSKSSRRRLHPVPTRHRLCTALVVAMIVCAGPAWAQRNEAPQSYSISAGSLADALDQLAAQSKVQIIYPADLVRGMRAPTVAGRQDWRQALKKLLAGSGLEWQLVNETTVAIRKAPSPPPVIRKPEQPSSGTQAVAPETRDLEAITVTGTRIRGGTSPSPVITIGSETIQQEGFTDLGEVIRSIPQNFSGGQNPGAGSGNIAGRSEELRDGKECDRTGRTRGAPTTS